MATETKLDLNEQTISKMQKLIRANIDSYKGFRDAAEDVKDPQIATLFREMADIRSVLATELQQFVQWNGEEAADDGTVAAAVHRCWMNTRSMLNGGDPTAILSEAERGEDHIKDAYEDVLKETAGSAMNDILQRQYTQIKAGHDRVRDLRDEYKSKNK